MNLKEMMAMLTIGHRFVNACVRDGGVTSAGLAARGALGDLGGEGALHGHVFLAWDLQNGRPWSGVGHPAERRLIVIRVLQTTYFGASDAVRVGDALAPALVVGAAQGRVHGDLDDD